ncbi:MAG TPA: PQQ-binding-like beta-propeller repeat protein [Candidatus Dormibacteraeota bacterium]
MLTRKLVAAAILGIGLAAGEVATTAAAAQPVARPHVLRTAAVAGGAWTVYHRDDAHTGFDSTQPQASTAAAGWTTVALDGQVYAEPLVSNGIVYAATLSGTVYAINQADGTVAWSKNVGTPSAQPSNTCGNVSPLGILGTPVIDTAAGRIYVSENLDADKAWHVFAIDLTTHAVVMNTTIPSNTGSGIDWTIQQQRGALALANGYVYVPLGGRAGDCGSYHGWVIGVPTSGATSVVHYETPSTASGVWAAGGVLIDDATGNVLFATGNAIPCSGAVNSDSIIRTAPGLGAATSFFQPNDWSNHWCGTDTDLGSATPVLISSNLAFTSGKYGQGFLLDPTNLGGKDGQVFPAQSPYVGADVCRGTHSDATFGSFAYAAPYVYITCQSQGIVGLDVDTTARTFTPCGSTCASPSWFTSVPTDLGPPIVAGGAVWAVSQGGGGLYGFDAATGAQIYNSAGFSANRFSTPSEAGGQIFVGAGNAIKSFNMVTGCSSATLSASPPTTQRTGNPVALTAGASGPNCTSPQFQFWVKDPSGTWSMVRDYSATNTFTWTAPAQQGTYYLGVHVKQLASAAPYEAVTSIQYLVAPQTCSAVTLSAAPASPQTSGTQVTLTASASGCSAPAYEFWASWAPNQWQIIRAYSTSSTYVWNSTGAPTGTYHFGVWACRDSACGPDTSDTLTSIPYSVNAPSCASVTASAAPTTVVHGSGTHVTITGAATGCTNSPTYEFWMRAASQTSWQLVQGYGTSATYDWNSTGALPGTVYFGVWTRDTNSTTPYDTYTSTSVTVT